LARWVCHDSYIKEAISSGLEPQVFDNDESSVLNGNGDIRWENLLRIDWK